MKSDKTTIIFLVIVSTIVMTAFINCGAPKSIVSGESALSSNTNCAIAPSQYRNPKTIDDVTKLVNALPKPVYIPCLIENLPRPLKIFSVESTFSGQPSVDSDNPRIFILLGNLSMSVTPKGIGSQHIEFGQKVSSSESVKAELQFPVISDTDLSVPYSSVRSGSGTSCSACHSGERAISGFSGDAFASNVMRPDLFRQQSASKMRSVTSNCNDKLDQFRCELLRSIFFTGQAQDSNFP